MFIFEPLYRASQLFREPVPARPIWPVPTPKPSTSSMSAGLRDLVRETAEGSTHGGPEGPFRSVDAF